MIVVFVGGGGLVSGIAIAVKVILSWVVVVGVEVEVFFLFIYGLAADRIVTIEVCFTLVDGLVGNLDFDMIIFDIVRRLVD